MRIFKIALLALAFAGSSPAVAQISYPPSDETARADAAQAKAAADAAAADAASAVKTVNGVTPTAGAVTLPIPTASNVTPPSVADSGVTGTMTTVYALANHTHASKARKGRVLVPIAGSAAIVFGTPMTTGAPLCAVTAEATAGDTNVVNAQIDGATTMTGFNIRITRTQQSVVALLGLTILSVPTQVATYAHYICVEP